MTTIVIGLALLVIAIFAIPLAILRAGIRSQERVACFACQPPGLCTALSRRLLGLSARQAACAGWCQQADTRPALASGHKESAS
jgi:hypothetical protein